MAVRAARGWFSVGLDFFSPFLGVAAMRLRRKGGPGHFIQSLGERLPFKDKSFDRVTALDVLEHVENPGKVLGEMRRILKPGGKAYLIVVSRFGFWDEHYKLPFINWLPRFLGAPLARALRPSKPALFAGRQSLEKMNYLTFPGFRHIALKAGFSVVQDLRETRIATADFPPGLRGRAAALLSRLGVGLPLYRAARWAFLGNFPVMLE